MSRRISSSSLRCSLLMCAYASSWLRPSSGEVGLLTRNIKVQASPNAEQTFFGGHTMAMVTSKMYVDGVELNRMGQHLELGGR